ncbi:hypothetical protein PIB30_056496 [Stylosanthes scabra]|uniref:Uncharacterized protein n=1 Tax=Stylosanthes scabra TaxID=79078 RepID=A0ABU6VKD5_9FABA|nr:hypothetical protein [Stylosanthes scabra]
MVKLIMCGKWRCPRYHHLSPGPHYFNFLFITTNENINNDAELMMQQANVNQNISSTSHVATHNIAHQPTAPGFQFRAKQPIVRPPSTQMSFPTIPPLEKLSNTPPPNPPHSSGVFVETLTSCSSGTTTRLYKFRPTLEFIPPPGFKAQLNSKGPMAFKPQ